MPSLDDLLNQSAALHNHLCPRQVLGVRMGMLAGDYLQLTLPQSDKRLITISESNGCGIDGISVATGCRLGRRTLFVQDFGKMAATFVDTLTGQAVRIFPAHNSRQLAPTYAPDAGSRWEAYLLGYQRIPAELLLTTQPVTLHQPLEHLLGEAGYRVNCELCGEEILNRREVEIEGTVMCRGCAGERYYRLAELGIGIASMK